MTKFFVSIKSKIIFLSIIVILLIIIIILQKLYNHKQIFVTISSLVLIIILGTNIIITQGKLESIKNLDNKSVAVIGRICSDYKFNSYGNILFEIDNVTFVDENSAYKISGKIKVSVSGYTMNAQDIQKGKQITFLGNVKINNYKISDISYISSNLVANATVLGSGIEFSDDIKLSLKEKIKDFAYKKFENNNVKYSGIAYAMLFGENNYIDENVKEIFQEGGIAHLLAVSGLHISVLIFVFCYFMQKLKLSKKVRLILIIIILSLYSYLCNFSVSIVRASIMALINMYSSIRGKHYDRLSSLSLTFCIITCLSPAKMFGYSLILSFSSVFIITVFTFPFEKLFEKIFNSKFAGSISLCLSIEIGLSIIQLCLFGYFPILSIFSNLICVPIATLAFSITIILLFISTILPFMSLSLKIFDYLIAIVIKFASWINRFGLIINFNGINMIFVLISLILIFMLSPYFNKRLKRKSI